MASRQGVKGSAVYKKKEGTLATSKDQKSILWIPSQSKDGAATLTIAVAHITNLQQTPETAAKVMLKIFEKSPDAPEPVTHVFLFNSATNPRGEANAIKEILTTLISEIKAGEVPALAAENGGASSAAMAIASAVASKPATSQNRWYDDAYLKTDMELQQSLMKKDPALHNTYMESLKTKPDTISNSQFNLQFWSTRTNLLRAHAVETSQKRGSYNALAAIKPRQADGELKLNISKEQIQLILNQHPLVRRVYDENVPKIHEADFWSRFFLSRLFKKLRGERVTEADSTDPTFDRYLDGRNDDGHEEKLLAAQIPHMIDLEGNEENQGGYKSGNRLDFTMRPGSAAKVPIVRTLNRMSEKIMAQVTPSDINPADPIGLDEETYNALALRDLQGDAKENRIMLNIKEQSQFFSNEKEQVSEEAQAYAKQIPSEVLFDLQTDVDPVNMGEDARGGLDLWAAIGVLEDSDSEDEMKDKHVGSKSSISDAQKQILEGVAARRTQIDGSSSKSALSGLSQHLLDRLTLTHATTIEFLHHFWLLFLSGDPDKAGELAKMVETLERALDRINAVAKDAETEREAIITNQKKHIRKVWEETGKKIKWNPNSVGGGEAIVGEMMQPAIKALDKASREYRKALKAEGVEAA